VFHFFVDFFVELVEFQFGFLRHFPMFLETIWLCYVSRDPISRLRDICTTRPRETSNWREDSSNLMSQYLMSQ
jgi:hypothetical protein